jgi:hypothetical protein
MMPLIAFSAAAYRQRVKALSAINAARVHFRASSISAFLSFLVLE